MRRYDKSATENILICEFMGYENISMANQYPVYKIPEHLYELNDYGQISVVDTFTPFWDDMLFSSKWDWLMPVVGKCVGIIRENSLSDWRDKFFNLMINVQLSEIHDTVVSFINWYNSDFVKQETTKGELKDEIN